MEAEAKVRAMTEVAQGYFVGSMDEVILAIAFGKAKRDADGNWRKV